MFLAWRQSFHTNKEVYELQNFTNRNRKNAQKAVFLKWPFFVEPVA